MDECLVLNNGCRMPLLGLGTWQSSEGDVETAVRTALDCGYRHIDTAYSYLNVDAIGDVIDEYITSGKLKRSDVFITTKLPFIYARPQDVMTAVDLSLKKLKLSYVDLYLIHGPLAMKNTGDPDDVFPVVNGKLAIENTDICAVWKMMERIVDEGKAKSIGVSNFNSEQIKRILQIARIKPVTNQIECHAFFAQSKFQDFLKKEDILITAYAPLGSPGRTNVFKVDEHEPVLLKDKVVSSLAIKYKKTPAQILLRNLIQRGIAVIPKSVTFSRIHENSQVFDFHLAQEDMEAIARLDRGYRMFAFKEFSRNLKEDLFDTQLEF